MFTPTVTAHGQRLARVWVSLGLGVMLAACASEPNDPTGSRSGAASQLPTVDLSIGFDAVPTSIDESVGFTWHVVAKNIGANTFPADDNEAVVELRVGERDAGVVRAVSFVSGSVGCARLAGAWVWECRIGGSMSPQAPFDFKLEVVSGTAGTLDLTATIAASAPIDEPTDNNRASQAVLVRAPEPCPPLKPCEEPNPHNTRLPCATRAKAAGTSCEAPGCLKGICDGRSFECQSLVTKCEDPNNPCKTFACDAASNECIATNKEDGTDCPAQGACENRGGRCMAGQCNSAPEVVCDDGNACTVDVCEMPEVGRLPVCKNKPKCEGYPGCGTATCDPRTGECGVSVAPGACDDGIDCTVDECTPQGCKHIPHDELCPDTNLCDKLVPVCSLTARGCAMTECLVRTHGDRCHGLPVQCGDVDNDACTVESCEPSTGRCGSSAKSCDDGNPCTVDSCVAGRCVNEPLACDDGVGCTVDACVNGVCVYTPDHGACDDKNACNGVETCSATGCQAGTPVVCQDNLDCTVERCDPGTGACIFDPRDERCGDGNACTDDRCDPKDGCVYTNNAARCDDGNACTSGDVCSGGRCGGSPVTCDDGNVCTDDTCDPSSGCVYANNAADCDDGNACTSGDVCGGGRCGGTPVTCNDGNVCTDDTCDPSSGCVYTNNAADCDDGNACTSGDVCSGGRCGGSPVTCDDGNVCTDDTCDPSHGCVYVNNSAPCDDGNACNNGCAEWEDLPAASWTLTNYEAGAAAHGLWLPGFNGGNGVVYMTLEPGTKLAWWDNGFASIVGTAVVTTSPVSAQLGTRYELEMYFEYRGRGAAGEGGGGPKMSGWVDYEDTLAWDYFDLTAGFLTGVTGPPDTTTFEQYPANSMMPFQLGRGANDKTLAFGAAMWMSFERTWSGGSSSGIGDLNADLFEYECPTGDFCSGGECVGSGEVECADDGNPCTAELCDPDIGCVTVSREGPCDDGNACTRNDQCGASACDGVWVDCDDGDDCTTDSCDLATGCVNTPIPGCGLCEVCTGVQTVTLRVSAWSTTRDQNETVRVRRNTIGGTELFQGQVPNNGTFTFDVPPGTTKILVTVQGARHSNETRKAEFVMSCASTVGTENGNSYVKFRIVDLVKRYDYIDCDDDDECTADLCTATGCTNTEVPGCRSCEVCEGLETLTLKVDSWSSSRDQNETVRFRRNDPSGDILFEGRLLNGGSQTVMLPMPTTQVYVTVQGAYHATETVKAMFETNCTLAVGTVRGNSYIKLKVTALTQRITLLSCDDGDACTVDTCTATGCTYSTLEGCGCVPPAGEQLTAPITSVIPEAVVKLVSFFYDASNNETRVCYAVRNDSAPPDISNFVFGIGCPGAYLRATVDGVVRNLGTPGPVNSGNCGSFNGLKVDDGLVGSRIADVCFHYRGLLPLTLDENFWVKAGRICGSGSIPGVGSCQPVPQCP